MAVALLHKIPWRALAPYLVGAGAIAIFIIGVCWFGHEQYQSGVRFERDRWEKLTAEAEKQATRTANERQQVVDEADEETARVVDVQTLVEIQYVDRVKEVYKDRDNPICLDADSLRLIKDADSDRVKAAISAASSND